MSNGLKVDRIDETVLALLYCKISERPRFAAARAWKSHNWDAMNRLHESEQISDPVSKAKSVYLTDEGLARTLSTAHTCIGDPFRACFAHASRSPPFRFADA